ncbi:MAG: DNA polymerase III subunit delta [Saprospiraceae bacterium]|nr:DNA polymerase III subunit delta [Saprospiraceae bacterium]
MTFDAILKDLKSKKYSPIYLLHGDESYYIDKISNYIEKNVLDEGEKAFNQAVLYGKDTEFKTVVDEARQFPMMSSYRVVVIKEAQDMRTLKNLVTYAENPSPQSIVVINHKHKKFDSRTKLAKAIKANGVLFESKKLYDNQVSSWVSNYVLEKGFSIAPDAAMMTAEFLGTDLNKIANEMDKVIVNLKEERTISADLIKEMVGISKDYNVFELQKAIGTMNTEKVFRIVDYFAANPKSNPLVMVLSNLYGYFSKVYIAAYHGKKNDNELKGLLGLPTPYFVKDYRIAAKNFKGQRLIKIFEALKQADLKSKGVGARNMEGRAILRDFMITVFYG